MRVWIVVVRKLLAVIRCKKGDFHK
jgi:hypothetical protein